MTRRKKKAKNKIIIAIIILLIMSLWGSASSSAKKVAKKKYQEMLTEKEMEEILFKQNHYRYHPEQRPDPFRPFVLKINKEKKKAISPLEKFDISEIKLVGIIETPSGKIAIIEDSTGKGYFVKRGMKIGTNNGIITKITKEAIYIREETSDFLGKRTKREIVLKLRPAEE